MAFDFFAVSSPEVVAAAVGALAFVVSFWAVSKRFDRGMSLIISLVIGFTAGWYLYNRNYSGEFSIASIFIYVLVGAILFVIVRAVLRAGHRTFKR